MCFTCLMSGRHSSIDYVIADGLLTCYPPTDLVYIFTMLTTGNLTLLFPAPLAAQEQLLVVYFTDSRSACGPVACAFFKKGIGVAIGIINIGGPFFGSLQVDSRLLHPPVNDSQMTPLPYDIHRPHQHHLPTLPQPPRRKHSIDRKVRPLFLFFSFFKKLIQVPHDEPRRKSSSPFRHDNFDNPQAGWCRCTTYVCILFLFYWTVLICAKVTTTFSCPQ
jgi:hypothetical protein